MASYIRCTGSKTPATDGRTISGADGKFFRLNGKRVGHCPVCTKSVHLSPGDIVPTHKEHPGVDEFGRLNRP